MAIVCCGLSHKTVPLPVLEQVAFTSDALDKSLAQLMDHDAIHEGVILSTCNRTEVYATVHRFHPAVQAIRRFISDTSGVPLDRISDGLYTYYDTDAVRHLFNVASGTDSMVVGEPQILGQVRDSFKAAQKEGTARRMLGALFQRALRVGKRARTETAIARHVVSLPQAAARTASELAGGLAGKRTVVIGAGRMAELAARAAVETGCTDIVIANRTLERGKKLAAKLGGKAVTLDEMRDALRSADVLIGVTSSSETIVDAEVLRTALDGRRLVAVDIAVPRDIDPAARGVPGVELLDLDDLRSIVEQGAERRKAELPKVSEIVEGEVEEFCAWERSLALGPAIESLREWAEQVREREVAKLLRKGGVDPDKVERLTKDLVNKLLHRPMTQMRELVRGKDGQVFLEAFQEIFDIDAE
jgi:glutamyl-tRNA reductase